MSYRPRAGTRLPLLMSSSVTSLKSNSLEFNHLYLRRFKKLNKSRGIIARVAIQSNLTKVHYPLRSQVKNPSASDSAIAPASPPRPVSLGSTYHLLSITSLTVSLSSNTSSLSRRRSCLSHRTNQFSRRSRQRKRNRSKCLMNPSLTNKLRNKQILWQQTSPMCY